MLGSLHPNYYLLNQMNLEKIWVQKIRMQFFFCKDRWMNVGHKIWRVILTDVLWKEFYKTWWQLRNIFEEIWWHNCHEYIHSNYLENYIYIYIYKSSMFLLIITNAFNIQYYKIEQAYTIRDQNFMIKCRRSNWIHDDIYIFLTVGWKSCKW